jgi:hypothetical protein
VLVPLAGGQGALEDVVPELPGVEDEPELDDPVFAEFDEPELAVLGVVPPVVPGIVPQGPPPGLVCGALGFTLEGCVLLPGVGGFGEFDPGTVPGVGLGVVGVDVPPGGVAVWPLPEGVVAPGVARPALPEDPLGAAPPAGALCAATQTAQKRSVESKVSFAKAIGKPPALCVLCDSSKCRNHPDDSLREEAVVGTSSAFRS